MYSYDIYHTHSYEVHNSATRICQIVWYFKNWIMLSRKDSQNSNFSDY